MHLASKLFNQYHVATELIEPKYIRYQTFVFLRRHFVSFRMARIFCQSLGHVLPFACHFRISPEAKVHQSNAVLSTEVEITECIVGNFIYQKTLIHRRLRYPAKSHD